MEKNIDWQEIHYQPDSNKVPCKRWGHKTIYLQDQIVLFGGFSDVTYLSDLWAYNIHTNEWREIDTKGKKPQGKSNFTMHFDSITNQLIIFGGGGPNKKRFNKISLLNWQTKQWTEIEGENQNSPWERTYHSSQFKYPYLITFGGQGAANLDFDDLWVFNIQTKEWCEIKAKKANEGKKQIKFQGRRFHSTAMLGFQFFVISGCRVNYTCIQNIFSIDLQSLFKTEQTQQNCSKIQNSYKWTNYQFSPKQVELIERWGHSSQAYNNKIYIFGGRNKDDFNDLLQFDPKKRTITKLITNQGNNAKLPKARRRHSSCMIGSSMIIFGGFNMEYFSDLQFISLFKCRNTLQRQQYSLTESQQIIYLEQAMFYHFLQQINKDKAQYDIQIVIQTQKKPSASIVKSKVSYLISKSQYFKNLIKNNVKNNPQRNTISLKLASTQISIITFQIFNSYLLKDLLILPKNCPLKRICQLLICADYFQNKTLFNLLQKILIIKVIDDQQNIDDVFNIAASQNLVNLLKVCSQKKIINHSYYNTYSKLVYVNHKSSIIKQKYILEMLLEVQFQQLHKGHKGRENFKVKNLAKNIKQLNLVAEQKGIEYCNNRGKRKKSFVQKVLQSFSRFCSASNEDEQTNSQQRQLRIQTIRQSQNSISSTQNQLKMF